MTPQEYQTAAARTANPQRHDFTHYAMLLVSEWHEWEYSDGVTEEKEEMGDMAWAVANLCRYFSIDFEEVCEPLLVRMYYGTVEQNIFKVLDSAKASYAYGRDVDVFSLADRLTTVMLFIRIRAKEFDSSLEEIMAENIAKLRKRYPGKFSAQDANARADKA